VNLGDVVNPGMTLVEIEGQGGLEVRATVEQAIAVALRPGAKVRAVVDGQSDPITATITAVAPAGDATTNRFEVKASLPATAGLRAGLFARLLVPGQPGEPQVTVPSSALFARGGLTGIFVVSEGQARLRWVAPGARAGDLVEIRAGVEAGERVVLNPTGLVDGAPVKEQRTASEVGFTPAQPLSGDERAGGPGGATPWPSGQDKQHPLGERK
jgi:RND family efflux transporter MFP subunit